MPGNPITVKMEQTIEARGGVDWLLERIADGDTPFTIAKSLGVSRWTLMRWVHRSPALETAMRETREKYTAEALAEKAMAIVDLPDRELEPGIASAQVSSRKNQADLLLRMAGHHDPKHFGKNDRSASPLQIGELHIHAMEAAIPTELLEAEVVEEPPVQVATKDLASIGESPGKITAGTLCPPDNTSAVPGMCQHSRQVTPEGQYTRWRCLDCGAEGDVPPFRLEDVL